MNCPYCNNILPDYHSGSMFSCDHPNVIVKFICSGEQSNPTIIYTQFRLNTYLIELNHDDQLTRLFNSKSRILSLNHIPKINPTNAEHWLDKLLNLKAFS